MKKKQIIIVGGGPAGMMAAIFAACESTDIFLLEKNHSLGRKLLLTGKGRCNVTNDCSLDEFLGRLSKGAPFLRDAFKLFFIKELMDFFSTRGCPLKVERQQRVFPVSDKSASILRVLSLELKKKKVQIQRDTSVKELIVQEGKIAGVILQDDKTMMADHVILTTGGLSFSRTGSTGDGFKMVEDHAHKIVSLKPALVALDAEGSVCARCEGLTLKNIVLTFSAGKKKIVSSIGEMVFTGNGISGPLVLNLSRHVVNWLENQKQVVCSIDFKPALNLEKCEKRLSREIKETPKAQIKSVLYRLLPKRLAEEFLAIIQIDLQKPCGTLTQKEQQLIIANLKSFLFQITGSKSFSDSMVSQGGIFLKDINPKTMESKKIKGLFFAGEIIDIDGDTGGFNLQVAWSTGVLAGMSAAG